MPNNDPTTPIQQVAPNDSWIEQYCQCRICSEVHLCVPSFDFYTTDDTGLLTCEQCFQEQHPITLTLPTS